jgi:hypothetical protein
VEPAPAAPGPPPPAPPRRRDPEFWIAVAALAVSACAMLATVVQVRLQLGQERAAVWPHVSAGARYSSEGFAFVAANKGLGPALVRRVELRLDGVGVAGWLPLLDRALGAGHGYGWDSLKVNDLEDRILAAGEAVELFVIPWDERITAAFGKGPRIEVTLCYCSFLGECWSSREGLDHDRVPRCEPRPR